MQVQQGGGHVDQLLRQTRAHHVALSTMADTKANMLLSISSVVIVLSFGHLDDPGFHQAAFVLIGFCLLTIVLAAYAAMPKLPSLRRAKREPDVKDPAFNILFFGDFVRLDYTAYEAAMERVLNDTSLTYETQVREVYNLGRFLSEKKYRYLRLAYLSFMAGLVGAGVVLLVTAVLR